MYFIYTNDVLFNIRKISTWRKSKAFGENLKTRRIIQPHSDGIKIKCIHRKVIARALTGFNLLTHWACFYFNNMNISSIKINHNINNESFDVALRDSTSRLTSRPNSFCKINWQCLTYWQNIYIGYLSSSAQEDNFRTNKLL